MAPSATFFRGVLCALHLIAVAGCATLYPQRVFYDEGGIRIGLEQSPLLSHTSVAAWNSHPVQFTSEQVHRLLSVLQVSGYSGTLIGLVADPPPIPVFSREELDLIVEPIAEAFRQAGPRERIFFSIPNLHARYHRERTEGTLFVRAPYLFVLLKDHSAFTRTDTGGGDDERDPRDHKGMRLSVAFPAKAAAVAAEDSPHWGPYEQVHLAIDAQQTAAAPASVGSVQTREAAMPSALKPQPPSRVSEPSRRAVSTDSVDDLRLQVRELTNANQDLRKQLSEQAVELDALKDALTRIQQDLNQTNAKPGSRRNAPAP